MIPQAPLTLSSEVTTSITWWSQKYINKFITYHSPLVCSHYCLYLFLIWCVLVTFIAVPISQILIEILAHNKCMNQNNIVFHQRAIFLIYLENFSLSLLIYWAGRVFMSKKMIADAMRISAATEAMAMPMTKGSDTSSSQCSPRYHQFSPTRHL